jgi:hypothetical protein
MKAEIPDQVFIMQKSPDKLPQLLFIHIPIQEHVDIFKLILLFHEAWIILNLAEHFETATQAFIRDKIIDKHPEFIFTQIIIYVFVNVM